MTAFFTDKGVTSDKILLVTINMSISDKGRVTYRFLYAMRHNDANKISPHPLLKASFPEFRQNR